VKATRLADSFIELGKYVRKDLLDFVADPIVVGDKKSQSMPQLGKVAFAMPPTIATSDFRCSPLVRRDRTTHAP
jgi:hypothetical protein